MTTPLHVVGQYRGKLMRDWPLFICPCCGAHIALGGMAEMNNGSNVAIYNCKCGGFGAHIRLDVNFVLLIGQFAVTPDGNLSVQTQSGH